MSNVAKLKKKALELEQKRQFDKAIAVYVELLEVLDRGGSVEEQDIAIFNRVGDLLIRHGNVADAMDYYERAVDHYTEGGFFNNAIALCNKILRQTPGRASVYYKLGRISAKKGFKGEAKQNFLEYADRMQKAGNLDEAFRALMEFADLCPDQDDIRQMLAEQLLKQGRRDEAIEQLQLLHEGYHAEGREAEAAATRKRLGAIDPAIAPRTGKGRTQQSADDLVFLDLDEPSPPRTTPYGAGTAVPSRPAPPPPPRKTNSLPFISLDPSPPSVPAVPKPPPAPAEQPRAAAPHRGPPREPPPLPEPEPPLPPEDIVVDASLAPSGQESPGELNIDLTSMTLEPRPSLEDGPTLEGITRTSEFFGQTESPPPHALHGLEPTNLSEFENSDSASGSLLDIDPTSLVSEPEDPFASVMDERNAFSAPDEHFEPRLDEPEESAEPTREDAGPELDFIVPADQEPRAGAAAQDMLAELEPPFAREAPGNGAAPSRPKPRPAAGVEKTTPRKRPPAEPLIPSLTLDDEFAQRFEEEKGSADAKPQAARWSPAEGRRTDPDEEPDSAAASPRDSTMIAAQSVEMLEAAVDSEPDSWSLRRELAEAMLEAGDREGGLRELEAAMLGAERANDLDHAGDIAEEIARIDPGTIRHHQKRVEYAFRTNDKPRLIEAYIALAEALLRTDQAEKARAVYQRVLDLAPDDIRAQAAIDSFAQMEAASAARRATRGEGRGGVPTPMRSHGLVAGGPTPSSPDFVNLGDWLRESQAPKDTRMVVPEHEPTGDEEADFQDMLRRFKQGIAENVDETDHQAHYDLGVAFKEMGLLDEAIAEFQKALRSPTNRVPSFEALGQCFMEKAQYPMAYTVLSRALNEKGVSDDQLVGVLYLLGRAAEAMSRRDEALTFYQRVFVVDITFRDIADRIATVERAGL